MIIISKCFFSIFTILILSQHFCYSQISVGTHLNRHLSFKKTYMISVIEISDSMDLYERDPVNSSNGIEFNIQSTILGKRDFYYLLGYSYFKSDKKIIEQPVIKSLYQYHSIMAGIGIKYHKKIWKLDFKLWMEVIPKLNLKLNIQQKDSAFYNLKYIDKANFAQRFEIVYLLKISKKYPLFVGCNLGMKIQTFSPDIYIGESYIKNGIDQLDQLPKFYQRGTFTDTIGSDPIDFSKEGRVLNISNNMKSIYFGINILYTLDYKINMKK